MPFVIGIGLASVLLIAFLEWRHFKHVRYLRVAIRSRDQRVSELEKEVHLLRASELKAKLSKLKPQPRRCITAQQRIVLAEYARIPEEARFTVEIIHDMAGSDCRAYANDFQNVFQQVGTWTISRSAVLRPGWVARCGLGVHVQNRETLSRAEQLMLNALAAAGIDYDLVRVPDLGADVGLVINPAPATESQAAPHNQKERTKSSVEMGIS
jgi:hypothetical protein